MKVIYSAVMEQLKNKLPELKWIDLDEGQLENYTERPTITYPCVLIGISLSQCEDYYGKVQTCDATVIIRVVQSIPTRRINSVATDKVRETALERYDLVDKVYAALQSFDTNEFSPLSRTRQNKETRQDGLFVYRIELSTTFRDMTAEV